MEKVIVSLEKIEELMYKAKDDRQQDLLIKSYNNYMLLKSKTKLQAFDSLNDMIEELNKFIKNQKELY